MHFKKNNNIKKSAISKVMTFRQGIVTLIISAVAVLIIINGSQIKKLEVVKADTNRSINVETINSQNEQINSDISTNENQNTSSSSSSLYKDGEYTGEAKGFKGNIKVKVQIINGVIKNIDILDNVDDPPYFNRALSLTNDIIKNNNTKVDSVSGATFSSKGIIKAVDNALKNAEK